MLSNILVIRNFCMHSSSKQRSRNVFYRDNVLYSYGEHFPLAIIGNRIALVNSDKWSQSTSRHTHLTLRCLNDAGYHIIMVDGFKLKSMIGKLDRWFTEKDLFIYKL